MQSRKHGDYSTLSSGSKLRAQHRSKLGSEPYSGILRDALDQSPVTGQSLNPHSLDGSRWVAGANRRSSSTERRDHSWRLGGGGGRSNRIRSKSPPFEQVIKRAQFDEGGVNMHRDYALPMELQRRYDLSDYTEVGDDSLNSTNIHGYHHGNSGMGKEKDFSEIRLSTGGGRGMLGQNSMSMEDKIARGSYQLPQDLGPTSIYGEVGGHLSSSSQNIGIRRIEHERLQYQDPMTVDKLPIMGSFKDGEKPTFQSREASYPVRSASHLKDLAITSPLKDLASSSSRMMRNEYLGSYQDDIRLPPTYESSRSSGKLIDPIGFDAYGQSPLIESSGDPETGHRNLTYYRRGAYGPTRANAEDDPYQKPWGTADDERGYQSDDLYMMVPPRDPRDYDKEQINYNHRHLSRPSIMHPVANRVDDNTEDSYGNARKGIILDHRTLQKQAFSDYPDMNRTSNASKQSGEYLGSGYNHVEFGSGVSRNYKISHLSAAEKHRVMHSRPDYMFGKDAGPRFLKDRLQRSPIEKDAGPRFLKDRLQRSPIDKYDSDMHRHAVRVKRVEELGLCEPLDRMLKGNNSAEEKLGGNDSRRFLSKRNAPGELQDQYDRGKGWIDEDESGLYSSKVGGNDYEEYRESKRRYFGLEHYPDFVSDEWLSSKDSLAHMQRHSSRLFKHGGRFTKANPRIGSLSSNDSHHFDRRIGLHKQPKVWKRISDHNNDIHEDFDDPSEGWVSVSDSEPAEDSLEFKQLVHEAYLKFSKVLNGSPAVQRRYKEQGKGGSLFCIVCGRSVSKEFMDTQRLVTHAFMTRKVGLRAQHLGLHKAICVLLGWNTVVPHDTITWVPQVLPNAEALAQKEDLILWPPVFIIHNISMSDNNPGKWKVITVEEIEAFLRRKSSITGRIKMCLGKPADQSVMVVKFLGTFTGLGDSEKLHKYFAENKHGRADFVRLTSDNSNSWDAGMQADKAEEHILYGYMGIAEDLDKVDFNTRKSNSIKSKEEIQDLANAPLRPAPDER